MEQVLFFCIVTFTILRNVNFSKIKKELNLISLKKIYFCYDKTDVSEMRLK